MRSAIIAHTRWDADDLYEKGLFKEGVVFSTHTSVNTYLKGHYNVDSRCLSEIFMIDEILELKEFISSIVDSLLEKLDKHVSSLINKNLGLDMRYFSALYSYIGKIHLSSYVFLGEGLKRLKRELLAERIITYNHKFDNYLETKSEMSHLSFYGNIDNAIKVIESEIDKGRNDKLFGYYYRLWKKIQKRQVRSMFRYMEKMDNRFFSRQQADIKNRLKGFNEQAKTILLYDSQDNLKLLSKRLDMFNLLKFSNLDRWGSAENRFDSSVESVLTDIKRAFDGIKVEGLYERVLLNDLKNDFTGKLPIYMNISKSIKEVDEGFPISLGIWGLSPNEKIPAIVFEYLKSKNKIVVGVQHGCLFGDSYEPWHFDCDFNRAKYYISYGFDENDLEELYPHKKEKCKILPVGFNGAVHPGKKAKKVDILFPITNNLSIFNGGMTRIPPHVLVERQIKILDYLDSLKGFTTIVKPFAFPTPETSSLIFRMKKLRNVKVIDYLTLNEFLREYTPRTIIIEYPSQPLFETLHLDADIFLLNDPIIPFDGKALKMLMKRVYYFEDVNKLIQSHDLFMKGLLNEKRDKEFLLHYIVKEDGHDKIRQLVHNLLN